MRTLSRRRLGDLLVDAGKISQAQLESALEKQKTTGKRLGNVLMEEGLLTEDDLLAVIEIQQGIPRIYLEYLTIEEEVVRAIPQSLAYKYNLIPISIDGDKINVVMSDPMNIFAHDDVRIATGLEVSPLIATSEEIKTALSKYYAAENVNKAADELSRERQSELKSEEERLSDEEVRNAPVVKLIDSIIDNAVKARASDIHVEPFESHVKIRYRVDGELIEVLKSPIETLGALTTRIKILANLNIAEKRVPQDGRILTITDGKAIDLRVSVLPTVHGEKVVIRILKRDGFLVGKQQLGMCPEDLAKLDKIVASPYGIILVTGPTGSGKSTTLYTVLSELNTPDKNIITVEDPVEYMIEGINQVNVNVKAGLTFAGGLRSILRQDPDIVMIGEIRDSETAEIAVRAAITGHLVLSTIHTNDAASTVLRLVDMGLEPYLISTSISGVIAQRLVRRVCPQCAEEYYASDYEKKVLEVNPFEDVILKRGAGCQHCNNTGYRGRTGVHEVMEINRDIREAVIKGVTADDLKDLCVKNGMRTLRMSCADLVLKGITTIDELIKIAYLKE